MQNGKKDIETDQGINFLCTISETVEPRCKRDEEAICRTATEPYHIESSGAAIMRPATLDFWACWGRPAENEYQLVDWFHE